MKGLKHLFARVVSKSAFVPPEEEAYRRLLSKGFRPDGIIDVGAYQGDWTRMAHRVFPHTPILMVEAQEIKKPFLDEVCAHLPGITYAREVLSATAGEKVTFYEMETGSSFFPEQSDAKRRELRLITSTLDTVAEGFPGESLFLKLDVQGAEKKVLEGGGKTLERIRVVQLEVALMEYNQGAPTIVEILEWMQDQGFFPFDIAGSSRVNGHLVQIDLMFTRKNETALRPDFINF